MPLRRSTLAIALLIAASALVYLAGTDRVHLWDRDEPRYAQTSKQMVESGDWIVPRFLDEVRTAKPIMIYWWQATSMAIFGTTPFAARLPSVIAMTLTLIVVATAIARWRGDSPHAFWTTFILATSGIVIAWSARSCLTDAVLLLFITIALLCAYVIYERGRTTWPAVIVLSLAIGLAGLTKGPVVLGVLGSTLLALGALRLLDRWRGIARPAMNISVRSVSLKTSVGLLIVAAVVGPWLIMIHMRAPTFLSTTIGHDVVTRMMEPLEGHRGPPGYYALTIWGTFFPWSLFIPVAIVHAFRNRAEPAVRFALASVLGVWIMFELIQTKLPHYTLPAFPALAFLVADALVRFFRNEHHDFIGRGFRIGFTAWALVVIAVGVAPWLVLNVFQPIPVGATVAWTILSLIYAGTVLTLFHRRKVAGAALAMGAGMMPAMLIAFVFYMPHAWFLQLPGCLAQMLVRDGGTVPGQVQMIGFKEPSLAFYHGGTIREQRDNDFLINNPPEQWPRWLVIRDDIWQRMPEEVRERFLILATCHGYAYSAGGRVLDVHAVRKVE